MALAIAMIAADAPALDSQDAEFFESKIRPILVESCVGCHGPKQQKSGLRMDSRQSVLTGGDEGPAAVPGNPEESPIILAVRYEDPHHMPPRKRLPDEAVESLTSWVKMGMPWPETAVLAGAAESDDAWKSHWAFQPVANPTPPEVSHADRVKNPIDRFVLARLEAKGLTPSATADKRTLIRRASFDLIGLPPTYAEVEAFVTDTSSDAFAKVIDRLLASPHYGERWGRIWLDVARYADTKGYVFLDEPNYPWAYTYRDYVVRSLNEDLPYDRFLVEQIAADKLPLDKDKRALAALGFLTVGSRFMNDKQNILDDRVDVVTRGLLGMTVVCARCHDHKFDPIPTEDYYSLYGIFQNSVEPALPPLFDDPPQTEAYAKFAAELKVREGALEEFLQAKFETLVQNAKSHVGAYLLAANDAKAKPDTQDFMLLADLGDLNPKMIRRWRHYLGKIKDGHNPVLAPWIALAEVPKDQFERKAAEYVSKLTSAADPAKPINPVLAEALIASPPKSLEELAILYGRILSAAEHHGEDYARRMALNGTKDAPSPFPAIEELRQVFHDQDAPANVSRDDFNRLELLPDRASQGKLNELRSAVDSWRVSGAGAPPRAMALEDVPNPSDPRVFIRGNAGNPGKTVPRQFLAVLSGSDRKPFTQGSGRLELAQAIADRNNPLTARVLVNRVWLQHMGSPLVTTPSDFGLRSDPPTNPELLDHLATVFMNDGWSLKSLHRRIMLSSTYQQSSIDRAECQSVDSENALYWRANRRRLEFEMLRDALLSASGRLDEALGGPGLPDIVAPNVTRRTLYASLDRLNLPGLYRTFDFPDPNTSSARRDTTTVAPQALFLMNHPFVIEQARATFDAVERDKPADLDARLRLLYQRIYARQPADDELTLLREYLGGGPADANTLVPLIQALLVSNEFAFID
jgi:hypothetical protein